MKIFIFLILSGVAVSFPDFCGKCLCFFPTRTISCKHSNLSAIPSTIRINNFYVFDFSNNQLTSIESANVLRASTATLRRLILRHNHLKVLPVTMFKDMTSLQYVDFSWNQVVTSLAFDHFSGVKALDYLSFSHNKIKCIQSEAFTELVILTELDLSYNQLTSHLTSSCFPRDAICSLKRLIVLRISSNHLPEIFNGSHHSFFACLPNLTLLQASNCGIKTVSAHALAGLGRLTSLDLSDNFIALWSPEILDNTQSLVYIDLGQNLLVDLAEDFLRGCPELTHLELRNNELQSLNYRWLNNLRGVKKVSNPLNNDVISRVEAFLSSPASEKTSSIGSARELYIDWSGNLWLCDCDILSFVSWVIDKGSWLADVSGYHDVICYDPAYRKRTLLLDVYVTGVVDKAFVARLLRHCKSPITTTSQYVLSKTLVNNASNNFRINATNYQNVEINHTTTTTELSSLTGTFQTTTLSNVKNITTITAFNKVTADNWKSSLPVIIITCVVLDGFASAIIILLFKNRKYFFHCRKRKINLIPHETSPVENNTKVFKVKTGRNSSTQ